MAYIRGAHLALLLGGHNPLTFAIPMSNCPGLENGGGRHGWMCDMCSEETYQKACKLVGCIVMTTHEKYHDPSRRTIEMHHPSARRISHHDETQSFIIMTHHEASCIIMQDFEVSSRWITMTVAMNPHDLPKSRIIVMRFYWRIIRMHPHDEA